MQDRIIIIQYHTADKKYLDELQLLIPALKQGFVVWSEDKIPTGSTKRAEYESALKQAVVAIFLISAESLSEEFLGRPEIAALLLRVKTNLKMLPLLVGPCLHEEFDWLQGLQLFPEGKTTLGEIKGKVQRRVALVRFVGMVRDVVRPRDSVPSARPVDRAQQQHPPDDQTRPDPVPNRETLAPARPPGRVSTGEDRPMPSDSERDERAQSVAPRWRTQRWALPNQLQAETVSPAEERVVRKDP